MPIHPDWKPLYDSMMQHYCDGSSDETSPEGGPCRKGEQVFYAYCREHGIDYTKPRPKGLEAFRWVGDVLPEEECEGRYLIRGRAIHPCKTYHPNEWPEVRVYLEEELKAAAETLTGKPLLLDHSIVLDPPNRVLKSAWEDGAVEFVAEVDEKIYNLVKSGEIKRVSIEYDWKVLEKVDGIAPRRIVFTGLSLLRRLKPGDPEASVEVWEGIVKKMKESEKMSEKEEPRGPLWERVWTRRYINDLPDSAFAIILPGGEKDETGRTVPRNLRKFPHHRMDGSIDLPHLRNANARVPQSKITDAQKARAMEHLNAHKKALGIGRAAEEALIERLKEQAGEVPEEEIGWIPEIPEELKVAPEPTIDELIQAVEDALAEINDAIDQINENFTAISARLENLEQALGEEEEEEEHTEEENETEALREEMERLRGELEEARKRIRDLEEQKAGLEAKLSLGEAIVEPGVPEIPPGYVDARRILAILPKQVPYRWGAGPHELVRRLRKICREALSG